MEATTVGGVAPLTFDGTVVRESEAAFMETVGSAQLEFDEVREASQTEYRTAMTLTLKPKSGIRRKGGIKPGDRFEFSVTGRTISITPHTKR